MEQEFDRILKFSTNNKMVYNLLLGEMKSSSRVMPFIGEALSSFAFGTRDDFIREVIQETTVTDREKEIKIAEAKSKNFLMVLDEMINDFGRVVIDQKLLSFYSEDKIDEMYMQNQPIYLIPYVKDGNCMTSSYDGVINHSYALAGKFPDVISPFNHKKITSIVRGNTNVKQSNTLFRLNGDLLTDSEESILTSIDFAKNYKENTEFSTAFSKWVTNYTILYIGVDIYKDGYLLDMIKDLKAEGIHHYAIIGCGDNDDKKKELYQKYEKLNIMPIIYDLAKPCSMEMIIHKLLVDTDSKGAFPTWEADYKYSQHDLVGREDEVERLKGFLNSEKKKEGLSQIDFKWWVIYGEEITGKSKLALDFARMNADGWEWYMLGPEDVAPFMDRQVKLQRARKKDVNLFLILDNFDWYNGSLQDIFDFETKITLYTEKLRILFILYDYEQSAIYEKIQGQNHDDLWNIMVDTVHDTPLKLRKLGMEEILILCHEFVYYCAEHIGIKIDRLEKIFASVDAELKSFVEDLLKNNNVNILPLSQMKALNLVKGWAGLECMDDIAIIEALLKNTILSGNREEAEDNFDVVKWHDNKNKRIENVKEIKNKIENNRNLQYKDSNLETELEEKALKLAVN